MGGDGGSTHEQTFTELALLGLAATLLVVVQSDLDEELEIPAISRFQCFAAKYFMQHYKDTKDKDT